ncbi:MAG: hypothetical protein FRX49_10133 [Trebouxia sp. A1-2]|nr:MAG: hypothetical protein FRX49_10133 [Trebouxia sp. A1-2]
MPQSFSGAFPGMSTSPIQSTRGSSNKTWQAQQTNASMLRGPEAVSTVLMSSKSLSSRPAECAQMLHGQPEAASSEHSAHEEQQLEQQTCWMRTKAVASLANRKKHTNASLERREMWRPGLRSCRTAAMTTPKLPACSSCSRLALNNSRSSGLSQVSSSGPLEDLLEDLHQQRGFCSERLLQQQKGGLGEQQTCSGSSVWNSEQISDESDNKLHYQPVCLSHARNLLASSGMSTP